jgi:DNA-binding HxlR family transcriptional regulator
MTTRQAAASIQSELMEDLVSSSSLSTPGAQSLRARASSETVRRTLERARELEVANKRVRDLRVAGESSIDVYSACCPSRAALDLIADKWAVLVAGCLVDGPKRHSWLRQRIGGISGKMLTRTLRELERAGLVERRIFPEVPPRVEYSLSPLGATLSEPVAALMEWAKANGGSVVEARIRGGALAERARDLT